MGTVFSAKKKKKMVSEAVKKQSNLMENILKFSSKDRPRENQLRRKVIALKTIQQKKVKILLPKQMLQRLQ